MRETITSTYPTTLQGIDARFIMIPEFVILHPNKKVLASYIYFYVNAGMDYSINFSFYFLMKWNLYKSNIRKNNTLVHFFDAVQYLYDKEIITAKDKPSYFKFYSLTNKSLVELSLNMDVINKVIDKDNFAIIYIDEILDIIDFYKNNSPNNFIDTIATLAFLRLKIKLRDNTDTEQKKPEAYYNFYKNIYSELCIGKKGFSRAINVLSKELGIIYLVHSKYQYKQGQDEVGKIIILPTIFCNYYHRRKGKIINGGKNYCETETNKAHEKMMEDFDIKKAINIKKDTSLEEADILSDWVEDTE